MAGAKKMAGDCDPSYVVEGQQKGPIHCDGDPQDHEDWDAISPWPTTRDPRLDLIESDHSTSKWDTLVNAPTRLDFHELAIQVIPRELIVNRPLWRQTRTLYMVRLALTTSYPTWLSTPDPTEMYQSSCAIIIIIIYH